MKHLSSDNSLTAWMRETGDMQSRAIFEATFGISYEQWELDQAAKRMKSLGSASVSEAKDDNGQNA